MFHLGLHLGLGLGKDGVTMSTALETERWGRVRTMRGTLPQRGLGVVPNEVSKEGTSIEQGLALILSSVPMRMLEGKQGQ